MPFCTNLSAKATHLRSATITSSTSSTICSRPTLWMVSPETLYLTSFTLAPSLSHVTIVLSIRTWIHTTSVEKKTTILTFWKSLHFKTIISIHKKAIGISMAYCPPDLAPVTDWVGFFSQKSPKWEITMTEIQILSP